jgi:hypothetical protein
LLTAANPQLSQSQLGQNHYYEKNAMYESCSALS